MDDKVKSTYKPSDSPGPGAYPGFCSKKRLGAFLLPPGGMLVYRNQAEVKILQDSAAGVSMFRIPSKVSILCRHSCKLGHGLRCGDLTS